VADRGQKERPARPDRRAKRARPVLRGLLAHQGRRGPQGPPGPPWPAASGAGESAVRVMRSNCQAATCRAECNEDEVLIVAYCGPRRSVPTFVNERTVTCPRGSTTSPLVAAWAKAAGGILVNLGLNARSRDRSLQWFFP